MPKTLMIADSGSTKTDWRMIDREGTVVAHASAGLNPYYQSAVEIRESLKGSFPSEEWMNPDRIFFYGAGCTGEAAIAKMQEAMSAVHPLSLVEVHNDLLGTARACLHSREGIACILGTGSNSCYYDGSGIREQIPAMGFILGDEGSGAVMGRKLVNAFFKHALPPQLKELFHREYALALPDLLERVYREPFPNRYLAGFTRFISAHLGHEWIREFVKTCFREFVLMNVARYVGYKNYPICFTGSVAVAYETLLREVLNEEGLEAGLILRNPADELMKFHLALMER